MRPPLELTEAHRRHWNLADEAAVRDHWREQWREHLAAVRAELPAERLLVFDIEAGDPRDLCRFAGLPDDCARNWKVHFRSLRNPFTRRLRVRVEDSWGEVPALRIVWFILSRTEHALRRAPPLA